MFKSYCDKCGKEIRIGDEYSISFSMHYPRQETKQWWVSKDLCRECGDRLYKLVQDNNY